MGLEVGEPYDKGSQLSQGKGMLMVMYSQVRQDEDAMMRMSGRRQVE